MSHPTDSHPPLGLRLKTLGVEMEELKKAALDVVPSDPAIEVFNGSERKEEEISAAYQSFLADRLGLGFSGANESPAVVV